MPDGGQGTARPTFPGSPKTDAFLLRRVFRCVGLVLPLFLPAEIVFAQTTYEAESAVLGNGAQSANCPTCSGGEQVKNIGGENSGTVTFQHLQAPIAGLYPMTVLYNVGDDRSFIITVNNHTRFDLIFPRTSRRNASVDSSKTILVPLKTGENTIVFGNAEEGGPDLDSIIVGAAPVESCRIAGAIKNADGSPLAGAEVLLSGPFKMESVTDAQGRYEFPFLASGDYYVRPVSSQKHFSPFENHCAAPAANAEDQHFTAREFAAQAQDKSVMQLGKWRIEYDLADGVADIFCDGKLLLANAFAVARLPETVTSMDYKTHQVTQETVRDGFGRGVKFVVASANGGAGEMTQTFRLYENADYFLTEMAVSGEAKVTANYMSPLTTQTPSRFLPAGDNRALFVPFDNDKWIRYDACPFGGEVISHEVTALYENTSRRGLIAGSIEHDTWKTGVRSTTFSNAITSLEIFGGFTSSKSRDGLAHGAISGRTIASPKVFIGVFADWRAGLEAYARANAVVAPPRVWTNGVPFGWNSWGKLQGRISFQKAVQVSDFFATELPRFENDGVVYVGLDSGWNRFTDGELKQFADHCHSNRQEAGIYLTPFASFGRNDESSVEGTDYKFKDLFLYANGQKQTVDGGTALDPTHPGTQQMIAATIARFKKAGFKYVKADFLTQGALEADKYFDRRVTTGLQAYNEGMKFVDETLGPDMYLNLSISPLFPAQYANSRRIACDTFGDIGKIAYTLNSLTYGWWLSGVYDFNDADHVVLDGYSEGENRARATSSVITGIFISGDDFSEGGSATGKERAKRFLNNAEVNAVAKIKKSFRPVEGNTANGAAHLFSYEDKNYFYLAAFNYAKTNASCRVDFRQLGLQPRGPIEVKELWSGTVSRVSNPMTIQFDSADARLYKFYKMKP
jgi:alpha-galactosidase